MRNQTKSNGTWRVGGTPVAGCLSLVAGRLGVRPFFGTDRPRDLGMPLVQVVLPSDGVVDQQGNPNQEGHAYSSKHDRIHGSISFLFRFFRFCNEGSNKGDEKARNGYYPNPFRTFLKEETYETCSQDDLSKVSEHSR